MAKTFETSVEIKGEIGQSFINAFRNANGGLSDLQREARAVQKELDRLGNDFRQGKIHQSQYAEETRALTNELDKLQRKQKVIDTVKSKASSAWNTAKTTASIAAFTAAAVGTAVAVKSLNVAADFEAQMSKVGAKTEATSAEMAALTQSALELGAKTSLSASESAIAMDSLAASGMNVNQIIKAMPGIISGAEASGEDLSLVSETVATALSVWGLEAEKASKVSDVLAMSANISAAGVQDFAQAFKYAGKPAADLGMTLEQTAAAISIMADSGIDGSSAGTSLRSSLLKLANPTKKQSELMKKYGISLKDSTGNAKAFPKLIGEIENAFGKLSNVDKTAALGTLVGTEAVSGFMTLMSAGEAKLVDYTKKLEQSTGSAAKASATMMDNFTGAKEQMLGAFESAQIAGASPMLGVFKQAFTGIGDLIDSNMPAIEAAGQRLADGLEDILLPLMYTKEPIKPLITPDMDPVEAQKKMIAYENELSKYNLLGNIDMSERIDYMLDQTIEQISAWIGGDGGDKLQKLFGELATLAAGAWAKTFTTIVKEAVSEIGEGDIGTALALGAGANALTGGLLLSGGLAGTKFLGKKGVQLGKKGAQGVKNKAKGMSAMVPDIAPTKSTKIIPPATTTNTKKAAKAAATVSTAAKQNKLGTLTKVAGKAALPLSVATGLLSVATADNKAEATGGLAGSLGGGLAGAKVGALIGTPFGPIGIAAGGAIGGLAGSLGGAFLGSKAGNAVSATKASTVTTKTPSTKSDTSGYSNSINQLATSTNSAKTNMDTLANEISNATRSINAINSLSVSIANVNSALRLLENSIRNVSINDSNVSARSGARLAYA